MPYAFQNAPGRRQAFLSMRARTLSRVAPIRALLQAIKGIDFSSVEGRRLGLARVTEYNNIHNVPASQVFGVNLRFPEGEDDLFVFTDDQVLFRVFNQLTSALTALRDAEAKDTNTTAPAGGKNTTEFQVLRDANMQDSKKSFQEALNSLNVRIGELVPTDRFNFEAIHVWT